MKGVLFIVKYFWKKKIFEFEKNSTLGEHVRSEHQLRNIDSATIQGGHHQGGHHQGGQHHGGHHHQGRWIFITILMFFSSGV